jgi:hypothetical protein
MVWFKVVNKKRVTLYKYNPFIFLSAPLIDERCSYSSMLDLIIICKLKG